MDKVVACSEGSPASSKCFFSFGYKVVGRESHCSLPRGRVALVFFFEAHASSILRTTW